MSVLHRNLLKKMQRLRKGEMVYLKRKCFFLLIIFVLGKLYLTLLPTNIIILQKYIFFFFKDIYDGAHSEHFYMKCFSSKTLQNAPIPRDHGGGGAIESNNIWHSLRLNAEVADTAYQQSFWPFCKFWCPNLNYRNITIFIGHLFFMKSQLFPAEKP